MTAAFQPRSEQELHAMRSKLIDQLHPRTVDDLEFLRSIDEITAKDKHILDTILALNFVMGEE